MSSSAAASGRADSVVFVQVKRRRDQAPPHALVFQKKKRIRLQVDDTADLLQRVCDVNESTAQIQSEVSTTENVCTIKSLEQSQSEVPATDTSYTTFRLVDTVSAADAGSVSNRLRSRWNQFRHGGDFHSANGSRAVRSAAGVQDWRNKTIQSGRTSSAATEVGSDEIEKRNFIENLAKLRVLDVSCSSTATVPTPLKPLQDYYFQTLQNVDYEPTSDEFVYDVFAMDADSTPLDASAQVVRIDQSWDELDGEEALIFDDAVSDVDSEDSNAEGHSDNSYPDEPSDHDESTDSSFVDDEPPYFLDEDEGPIDFYDQTRYS